MWLTPLCPAGHLPHKEGDWLGSCSSPYQQPSRWPSGFHESISPPVGEMPGRAEGGKPHPPPFPSIKSQNTQKTNLKSFNIFENRVA
ncbi:hypothetical protein CTT39_07255 [Agrobacterium rosae]|nr:hypothetical protein CTT39_07255 [Agrobacterium rosae]